MARQKTHLSLDTMTIGYLRYLLESGETDTLYNLVDTLVLAYVENYAEETGTSMSSINKESIELFEKSRRPQSAKSKAEQMESARKSLHNIKVKSKKKSDSFLSDVVGSLKDGFTDE